MSLLRFLLLRLPAEPQRSLCRGETGSRKGGNPRADLGHRLSYSLRFLGFSIIAARNQPAPRSVLRTVLCKRPGSPALVSSCQSEQCLHCRTNLGEKIGFWGGNVVLVSLWPNDDVMWDLGANQAMSGFQCLSALRCDALTWSSSPQHQELLISGKML